MRFLDLKNIDLDTNIVILSALVRKFKQLNIFYLLKGPAQNIFDFLKGSDPSYLVLKFDNIFA